MVSKMAPIICLSQFSKGCGETLKDMLWYSTPRGSNIPIRSRTIKLYTEQRYYPAVMDTAITFLNKAIDHEDGGKITGNIHSDITNAFKVNGFNQYDAEKASLEYLGSYSNRAASLLSVNISYGGKNKAPYYAHTLMSAAISYFDKITYYQSQYRYALPHNLNSKCLHGKPYHFWMAFYLAYHMRENNYPKKASYRSSYIIGMGYHLFQNGMEGILKKF